MTLFMVIRTKQIKEIEAIEIEKFISRAEEEIKTNYSNLLTGAAIENLRDFIKDAISFCNEYTIEFESNIFKIILCKMEFDYTIPLHPALKKTLDKSNTKENIRVENFINSITSGRYRLIIVELSQNFL